MNEISRISLKMVFWIIAVLVVGFLIGRSTKKEVEKLPFDKPAPPAMETTQKTESKPVSDIAAEPEK